MRLAKSCFLDRLLLRDRVLAHVNEVWRSVNCIPTRHDVVCLTEVIDWFSGHLLSLRLSNTLEGQFCLEGLDEALTMGWPVIFNTDQSSQFMGGITPVAGKRPGS